MDLGNRRPTLRNPWQPQTLRARGGILRAQGHVITVLHIYILLNLNIYINIILNIYIYIIDLHVHI